MMKKVLGCLIVLTALSECVSAQDEFDALRYSNAAYQGTARGMGIGGAVGSIGADFSALSVNPAGIGIYKTNELMFTPSFNVSNNNSSYLGGQSSATESKLNLMNFGLVLSSDLKSRYKESKWKTFNFGVGMNRVTTFKNEFIYAGKNNSNSLIESFADDFNSYGGINSTSLNSVNFSAYGAYETYLIDKGQGVDSSKAVSYVPYAAGLNQSKKVTEKGGMTEYLVSVGGNYMDKLMLGATMGIFNIDYDRTMQFSEEDISGDLTNDFKYFTYTERLTTTGTGINLKLGAMYKPNANMRFGLALHTPTHIELNDASTISMVSHTDSLYLQLANLTGPVNSYNQDSALVFNYSLNTPYKALVSGMFLFGKRGFVTADIEYLNYASMKYNYGEGYENATNAINNVIQNMYKEAVNIRIGAEAKLSNFCLRSGFGYYGSPYQTTSQFSQGDKTIISGGIGYREQNWFIDATYSHSTQRTIDIPYVLARADANVQQATIKNGVSNVLVTFGVKF